MKLYRKHYKISIKSNFYNRKVATNMYQKQYIVSASTVSIFKQKLMNFGIEYNIARIWICTKAWFF